MRSIFIIIAAMLATILTRLSVLWLPNKVKASLFLEYLSKYLPVASFGLLVIYSLKETSISDYPYGVPELIGLVIIVILQYVQDNIILSIFVSSIVYVLLVNLVY